MNREAILVIVSSLDFGVNESNLDKNPITFLLLIISGFVDAFATVVSGI